MKDLDVNLNKDVHSFNLAGKDIMPRKYSERTVTPVKLTAIWFAMAIEVTLFMSAAQLYETMTVAQILLACFVGHCLLFAVMWVTQDIGVKYGVPFSVALRPSFGYVGSLVAAYFRTIPAIFWFGFQTWVAASAMNAIMKTIWGPDHLMLWIILVGAVQIIHTTFGIKAVTRLSVIATPMLLFVGLYILYIAIADHNIQLSTIWNMSGSDEPTGSFLYATMSFMGGWATLSISIMDITRDCKVTAEEAESFGTVTKRYLPPQWIGIVPAVVFYTFIGVLGVITTGYSNPADILVALSDGHGNVMMIICLLFILIATWCTNDTANLFPAAYTISSTFPKHINFAKGIVIAGIIGLLARPWAAADSLVDVMVVIGNLLAPVSGILIADYFFLRKRKLSIEDLYDINGEYHYWHNINPAAVIAIVAGVALSWNCGDFQFFVALFCAGILYYLLMKFWIIKKYPQKDIEG